MLIILIHRASVKACIVDKIVRVQQQNLERIGNGSLLKAFKGREISISVQIIEFVWFFRYGNAHSKVTSQDGIVWHFG